MYLYPTPAVTASFDYYLTNSGNRSVTKSGRDISFHNTITINHDDGELELVSLSLSPETPNWVTFSTPNNPCYPTCQQQSLFTVSSSAPIGTYQMVVIGTPLGRRTSFNLTINNNSGVVSTSCSASPSPGRLGQSTVWTASPSGGTPPYTYSWSGTAIPTPAPATNPYSKVYTTIGSKGTSVRIRDSVGSQFTANCTTWINFAPTFQEF